MKRKLTLLLLAGTTFALGTLFWKKRKKQKRCFTGSYTGQEINDWGT